MTSCLVLLSSAPGASALAADLESVGIHVIGAVQRNNLVQESVRLAPDLVVVHEVSVSAELFDTAALLLATAPRPLVVFTSDPDVDKMARALEVGVHAYEVNGYGPQRLRAVIHLAQLRFVHEQKLRDALADVSHRFEERKLVDRAKGILMRARQVSEDEAFRVLRAASMHSNQRVGQVSQQLIAAAGNAEALNRAGQLRMLSQRLVKLRALHVTSPADERIAALVVESTRHVDANLSLLSKSLSAATYGDLIEAVLSPWSHLKVALAGVPGVTTLAQVDVLAERMLLHADRLVSNLETTALTGSLHVINVAGRQRMLSQRVAKQAMLATLLAGDAAVAARLEGDKAFAAFEEAMRYLGSVPLSTREIIQSREAASHAWADLTEALQQVRGAAGRQVLLDTSEALLALFEQLTERYERSMQILLG
ncbi:MAG: ANTAR domain-containing protein [Burkholderiales bacterium]